MTTTSSSGTYSSITLTLTWPGRQDPPTAGVREPRRPLPVVPSGAIALTEETPHAQAAR
jgi:hypothetical protein